MQSMSERTTELDRKAVERLQKRLDEQSAEFAEYRRKTTKELERMARAVDKAQMAELRALRGLERKDAQLCALLMKGYVI